MCENEKYEYVNVCHPNNPVRLINNSIRIIVSTNHIIFYNLKSNDTLHRFVVYISQPHNHDIYPQP